MNAANHYATPASEEVNEVGRVFLSVSTVALELTGPLDVDFLHVLGSAP